MRQKKFKSSLNWKKTNRKNSFSSSLNGLWMMKLKISVLVKLSEGENFGLSLSYKKISHLASMFVFKTITNLSHMFQTLTLKSNLEKCDISNLKSHFLYKLLPLCKLQSTIFNCCKCYKRLFNLFDLNLRHYTPVDLQTILSVYRIIPFPTFPKLALKVNALMAWKSFLRVFALCRPNSM